MKTYISDIIPKIQKFSQKLDNITLLTNQHWVVLDQQQEIKTVYIFRSNGELLISSNGKVNKAKWEYLDNNSLLIDRLDGVFLFRHGFVDDNILALKVDGKNEYALFVSEQKFKSELNSIATINLFLETNYNDLLNRKEKLNTNSNKGKYAYKRKFDPQSFLEIQNDILSISSKFLEHQNSSNIDLLIGYLRYDILQPEIAENNKIAAEMILKKTISFDFIKELFIAHKDNLDFINDLENYIRKRLN